MNDLKVKCTICGKEESNKETVKEIAEIIEKYDLKAEHYLSLLNLMSGKCLDSNEHSFIFDEEFLSSINEIVEKYKSNLVETEKLRNNQRDLVKEIDETVIKLKDLRSNQESNDQRLQNIYEDNGSLNKEVSEITGTGIDIWKI